VSEPEVSVVDAINLAEINKQNQRGNSKPQEELGGIGWSGEWEAGWNLSTWHVLVFEQDMLVLRL